MIVLPGCTPFKGNLFLNMTNPVEGKVDAKFSYYVVVFFCCFLNVVRAVFFSLQLNCYIPQR